MKITVTETLSVPSELKYSRLGFHFFGKFDHPSHVTTEFTTPESAIEFVKSRKKHMADAYNRFHVRGVLYDENSRNFQKTDSGYAWEEYRPYGPGWIAPNGCGHQSQKWFKLEYAAKIEII